MKKQQPDKDILLYLVLEVKQSELVALVQQIKDSKKLKYKYHWINNEWHGREIDEAGK